jgi:hypothetical protein
MKTHSREWFLKQVANARDDIAQWPEWMKEGSRVATASFPRVGDVNTRTSVKSVSGQFLGKKK